MRVAQLDTGMACAEDPLSRARHLIGNLAVAPLENGELQAKTAFLVCRSHLETGACGNRSRRRVMPDIVLKKSGRR
jgi:3-phenylpropionate/cinnamic acid dioxygenase small subunit